MELATHLRERLPEIEETIFVRMVSVADPAEAENPEYVLGLRMAVKAGIEYGLAALESEGVRPGPLPTPLLTQARSAARIGISLDVVLRRYFAGYTLLGEFVTQEAERHGSVGAEEASRLARVLAPLFDDLVAAVTAEYTQESEEQRRSVERARTDRVKKLLAGEVVDDPDLEYELGGSWHVGLIVAGPGARQVTRRLATRLDLCALLARSGEGTVWGWLGGKDGVSVDDVVTVASADLSEEMTLSVGEAAHGLFGWRLTHRQALAAQPIARRDRRKVVRYRDVALLASALRDDVLSCSLDAIYLAPLAEEQGNGDALRQTLRAYFGAGRNVSSAAAKLGVSRKTVSSRLRTIEERIGRPPDACAADLETALRLQSLSDGRIPEHGYRLSPTDPH